MNKFYLTTSALLLACLGLQAEQVMLSESWDWAESGTADRSGVIAGHPDWRLDNGCFGSGIYVDSQGSYTWETVDTGYGYSDMIMSGWNTGSNWWTGFAFISTKTFNASMEKPLVIEAIRDSLTKDGRARSGLWMMAPDKSKYFIFSDNFGEGGWEYNAFSGLYSDNPVGNGIDIAALAPYNDTVDPHTSYRMRIVSNGQNAKLYLKNNNEDYDDQGFLIEYPWVYGTTVPLNFSEDIAVGIGAYCRAPASAGGSGDFVEAAFGTLTVTSFDAAYFAKDKVSVGIDKLSDDILIKVPASATASSGIVLKVSTSNVAAVDIDGAADGVLTVAFQKGETEKAIRLAGKSAGVATISIEAPENMLVSNELQATVLGEVGVAMIETFDNPDSLDENWEITHKAFENGTGPLTVAFTDGQLIGSTTCEVQAWSGGGIHSKKSFTATPSAPLHIKLDRISLSYTASDRGRSGICLCNEDRSVYAYFNDDPAENGWVYNINATGRGTDIAAFGSKSDGGMHVMEILYDGSNIQFFLDGELGASSTWNYSGPIFLEIDWFSRIAGTTTSVAFDNLLVENTAANGSVSPDNVVAFPSFNNLVTVSIPEFAVLEDDATITLTSKNPEIAFIEGAVDGVAKVTFEKGETSKTLNVVSQNPGETEITLACNDEGKEWLSFNSSISVRSYPEVKLCSSDDFSGNLSRWKQVERSAGATLDNQKFYIENGELIGFISAASGTNGGSSMQFIDAYYPTKDYPIVLQVTKNPIGGQGNQFNDNIGLVNLDTDAICSIGFARGDIMGWKYFPSNFIDNDGGFGNIANDAFSDNIQYTVRVVFDGEIISYFVNDTLAGQRIFEASKVTFALGGGVQHAQNAVEVSFDDFEVFASDNIAVSTDSIELTEQQASFDLIVSKGVLAAGTTILLEVDNPQIAQFATGKTQSITVSAGSSSVIPVTVRKTGVGSTFLTITTADGYPVSPDTIAISALSDEELLFLDEFDADPIDESKWYLDTRSFEYSQYPDAAGDLNPCGGGTLYLDFNETVNYWGGASYITRQGFKASALSPLTFEVDRLYFDYTGTGSRCAFLIYEGDGSSRWINFADAFGTNAKRIGWGYNRCIGEAGDNVGGDGTAFAPLSTTELLDKGNHTVRIVLDGKTAAFYVDGVYGGSLSFPVSEDIHFGIGLFARASGDNVYAAYEYAKVTGSSDPLPDLPVITNEPADLTIAAGENATFLVGADSANVSFQWYKDGEAIDGATQSSLFIENATEKDAGNYFVVVSNRGGSVTSRTATLTVLEAGKTILFTDNFSGSDIDFNSWILDTHGFEYSKYPDAGGTYNYTTGEGLNIDYTLTDNYWGGTILYTAEKYTASAYKTLSFVVDRGFFDYAGTGARCSIIIRNDDGSKWINIAEAKDNAPGYVGWIYNRCIGEDGDSDNGLGVRMTALNGIPALTDKGRHEVKVVANGSVIQIYVDDVLGAEVDFPVSEGIQFGLGVYARAAGDNVKTSFLKAQVYQTEIEEPVVPTIAISAGEDGMLAIDFVGNLQEQDENGEWKTLDAVSPYTIVPADSKKLFRAVVLE